MSFKEVYSPAWKEFKQKFKFNSKIIFYFVFIPGLLGLVFSIMSAYSNTAGVTIGYILFVLASIFLSIFASLAILFSSIFDVKSYSSAIAGGKKFYWRYIGLGIVTLFFIILLFLALIIPAIIFGVYWTFSTYILVGENKGIMDSLRGSFRLIRNHWWMVVGYGFLFGLIIWGIQILFSIPSWPANVMVALDVLNNPNLYAEGAAPTSISLIASSISTFFSSLSQFIVVPFGIIFGKYLYLYLKKKKK
jgi:uncharacterized membrane protein